MVFAQKLRQINHNCTKFCNFDKCEKTVLDHSFFPIFSCKELCRNTLVLTSTEVDPETFQQCTDKTDDGFCTLAFTLDGKLFNYNKVLWKKKKKETFSDNEIALTK